MILPQEIREYIERIEKYKDRSIIDREINHLISGELFGIVSLSIKSAIKSILSGHAEFDFEDSIDRIHKLIIDNNAVEISVILSPIDVRIAVDRKFLLDYISSSVGGYNKALKKTRENLGVKYNRPIQNSYFLSFLLRRNKLTPEDIQIQRFKNFSPLDAAYHLAVIYYGNINFPYEGYGGFRLFSYSGIDFIGLLENETKRILEGVTKKLLEVKGLVEKLEALSLTDKLSEIISALDREIASSINSYIRDLATGNVRKGDERKYIQDPTTKKWYEIIRTKKGRIGLRYSFKLNKRRFERE